jgi:hypothetical protein
VSGAVWHACYSCRDYALHRRETLAVPLADKARREGRDVIAVVDEFMLAAHDRHMAGEPLRPDGPTRVTNPAIGRLAALLSPGLFGPAPTTAQPHDEVAQDAAGGTA